MWPQLLLTHTKIAAAYRLSEIDKQELHFKLRKVGYFSSRFFPNLLTLHFAQCYCLETSAGWAFVDNAFACHARDCLGPEDWERLLGNDSFDSGTRTMVVRPKLRMFCGRFEPIKHGFDGSDQRLGFPVQLPQGIATEDKPEMGILNGALKISTYAAIFFFYFMAYSLTFTNPFTETTSKNSLTHQSIPSSSCFPTK